MDVDKELNNTANFWLFLFAPIGAKLVFFRKVLVRTIPKNLRSQNRWNFWKLSNSELLRAQNSAVPTTNETQSPHRKSEAAMPEWRVTGQAPTQWADSPDRAQAESNSLREATPCRWIRRGKAMSGLLGSGFAKTLFYRLCFRCLFCYIGVSQSEKRT